MSAMKPYCCWTIFYLLIFAVLILTLASDGVNSDCSTEIIVRRNAVHKALFGQQFRINCTVIFCNVSPPTVTWHKVEETAVPLNVSSDSHIKTEWKLLKDLEGVFYLIFQNVLRSDSGQYQCRSGGSVSHAINVTVIDNVKLTTATWTSLASESTIPADTFLPYVYRVVGTMVFVTIVILICVIPKRGCKGKSRKAAEPSDEPIYENDL